MYVKHYIFNSRDKLFNKKVQDKPSLQTGQKSASQHLLFSRYANFSKLMPTVHTPPPPPPWLVHFNANIVNVLHSKVAIELKLPTCGSPVPKSQKTPLKEKSKESVVLLFNSLFYFLSYSS